MLRLICISLLAATFSAAHISAAPAYAGSKEAKAKGKAKSKGGNDISSFDEIDATRAVELNGMVFPVIVDGRLTNYLFVNARMAVAQGKSTWTFREQAHFIRDAVLRAAHRESLHLPGDETKLDVERATEICLRVANEAVGETNALDRLHFMQIDSKGFMGR